MLRERGGELTVDPRDVAEHRSDLLLQVGFRLGLTVFARLGDVGKQGGIQCLRLVGEILLPAHKLAERAASRRDARRHLCDRAGRLRALHPLRRLETFIRKSGRCLLVRRAGEFETRPDEAQERVREPLEFDIGAVARGGGPAARNPDCVAALEAVMRGLPLAPGRDGWRRDC